MSFSNVLHSANRLTWHGGVIPEGEIWLKIGGDKGGKSVKSSFQICNTPNPNSVQNTVVFSVFQAKDTPINLHIAPATRSLAAPTKKVARVNRPHRCVAPCTSYPIPLRLAFWNAFYARYTSQNAHGLRLSGPRCYGK